jgi:molybdopterin/thiamine biosynthesis adenylyltransferase
LYRILNRTLLFSQTFSNHVIHRLRAAKVLLIGLDGFGAEIAKNIILAGVNSVTFLDHRNVTELDRCSQFFVPKEDIGKNVNVKQ